MLVKGIMTSVSGSLGGITGSHNSGGLYLRARRVPVNPMSAGQVVVRDAVRDLVSRWNETLDDVQRESWRVYAANVPLVGPLGDPRAVSGLNMYVRSNVTRRQVVEARVDDAPTVFDLGAFTAPVYTVDESNDPQVVSVAFVNTDEWAAETGSRLVVYVGLPQNPGVFFYGGPFRLLGSIEGAATPPTSPVAFNLPFAVVAGQKLALYSRVTRADGRLSGRSSAIVTVVA